MDKREKETGDLLGSKEGKEELFGFYEGMRVESFLSFDWTSTQIGGWYLGW